MIVVLDELVIFLSGYLVGFFAVENLVRHPWRGA